MSCIEPAAMLLAAIAAVVAVALTALAACILAWRRRPRPAGTPPDLNEPTERTLKTAALHLVAADACAAARHDFDLVGRRRANPHAATSAEGRCWAANYGNTWGGLVASRYPHLPVRKQWP